MLLRVYAKPGNVLYVPGTKRQGAPPRYVGRRNVVQAGAAMAHPATEDAFTFEEFSDVHARLARRCQLDVGTADGAPVWAADPGTATALGIPFVDVAYDKTAGEWMPAKPAAEPRKGGTK